MHNSNSNSNDNCFVLILCLFYSILSKTKSNILDYCKCINDDLDKYCNNLNGDKLIGLFEMKWMGWDIKDCVKWFKYILTCKMESDNYINGCIDDHDYAIDNLSDSDSDSDSELEDSNSNCNLQSANNHTALLKQMAKETTIDYTVIEKNLHNLKFRSKRLGDLRKPFLFRQYGFTNKYHRKLLCKYIKQMVNKYPKQSKKRNRMNTNKQNQAAPVPAYDHDSDKNVNIVDPNLEVVVEQTPLSDRQSLD